MRWPIAVSAIRPISERCGTASHSCGSAISRRPQAATPGCSTAAGADATNHCYGLAFVLLAYAHTRDGRRRGGAPLDRRDLRSDGAALLGRRGATAADEASPDWSVLSPYRGQNANMHACEALLGLRSDRRRATASAEAASATTSRCARPRSRRLVGALPRRLEVDWDYNKDDRLTSFRPGYQPGHLTDGRSCC
jgi:mannose/cellobiose epimerase-like protein (N-acyl-D-glucosamine 2-epimerase family)